jgi:hypothetical protein
VVSSPHKSMEFQLRAPHVHAALVAALGPPDGWKDKPLVTCMTNDATQEYNKKATRSACPPFSVRMYFYIPPPPPVTLPAWPTGRCHAS